MGQYTHVQLTFPLLIIYIDVTSCMLYFELLFCSPPRALAARVYYVKLLPTWNKDYLSIYLSIHVADLCIWLVWYGRSGLQFLPCSIFNSFLPREHKIALLCSSYLSVQSICLKIFKTNPFSTTLHLAYFVIKLPNYFYNYVSSRQQLPRSQLQVLMGHI